MKQLVAALALSLCVVSCGRETERTVKRAGQPDMTYVSAEDRAMNAAIQKAVSSLPTFKATLSSPPPDSSGFAVKVAFAYGDNQHEHIWLTEPSFANGRIDGVVNNEPVDVTTVKLGQHVTASEADISDWMYVQQGVLRGGYTIRVLLDKLTPAERESQLREMGVRLE